MERDELIAMLNKDLPDEHASVVRYLIHAYQVGEDTPLGEMLLATAREEMWHMDWLGDEIGERGAEPNMTQAPFPHDPTSNASLLRSYIAWEANLIGVYAEQAASVDNPELARILRQLGEESVTHKRRFEMWLEKLGEEGEKPFEHQSNGFSSKMYARLQYEVVENYKLVLQHLRDAFVLEDESCPVSSELELTAMRHMKHLSYFAEELAENGRALEFPYPGVERNEGVASALKANLQLTHEARQRFQELAANPEVQEETGLKIEIDNMITRNDMLAVILGEMLEGAGAAEAGASAQPDDDRQFTVGSLLGHEADS